MATSYKILYQYTPSDTSAHSQTAVSSGVSQIISSLVIANVTASDAAASVYVKSGAAGTAIQNAILYNVIIEANSSVALSLGITLTATDVISFQSGTATALTFTAFGTEIV
jgi:hypothetical protein